MSISATRVETYDAVCPAQTPTTAPIELALFDSGDYDVVAVTVVIPDGHAGTTGLALAIGHQPILPRNPGNWISGNDEEPRFNLKGYPRGAPWTVFVCNQDLIAHNWQLRFEFDDAPVIVAPASSATPINPSAIYDAAGNLTP